MGDNKSLIRGDGINKTMMWRSARPWGTSQMRKRSPLRHAGVICETEFFHL